MYKIIIYFLLFTLSFSSEKISIKKLKLSVKDKTTFATLDSLNNIGLDIKKDGDSFIITTDKGKLILNKNKIIAPHKNFTIISSPFKSKDKDFLPLNIILTLNNYKLTDEFIVKNEKITSPKIYPTKVISLAPGVTEKIFALGAENLLIGRTKFSNYPKEVENIDIVGTMFEPNLEIIVNKSPDIVIAETHFKDKLESSLNSFGIQVLKFQTPKNILEIYDSIYKLGALLDRDLEARGLNASLEDKVAYTKNILEDEKRPSVYYVLSSGKSDITAGGDTFINSLIEISGGSNIASNKSGWSYSLEELILNDPSIIFGSKRNIDNMLGEENYQQLSAIKNKNYFVIEDDSIFNLPGPRALTEGVYQMGKIFHPEKAKELEKIRSIK